MTSRLLHGSSPLNLHLAEAASRSGGGQGRDTLAELVGVWIARFECKTAIR